MQGFFEKSLIWPLSSTQLMWYAAFLPLIRHGSAVPPSSARGGRLIGATIETTVQWGKFQRWSLPSHRGSELWDPTPWAGHFPQTSAYLQKPSPSRGKVAPPQAVTDEGEKNQRSPLRCNLTVLFFQTLRRLVQDIFWQNSVRHVLAVLTERNAFYPVK